MSFADYLELLEYWGKNPPIHILVKAIFSRR